MKIDFPSPSHWIGRIAHETGSAQGKTLVSGNGGIGLNGRSQISQKSRTYVKSPANGKKS